MVEQGDCILSVAAEYGLPWQAVWNHPANADLRNKRTNPGCLLPGDVVAVPDLQTKSVPCPTEAVHKFTVKVAKAYLRLQVFDGEEPRANQAYRVDVDGQSFTGTADADGKIEQAIPAVARKAHLVIGPDQCEYDVDLGHMDPSTEESGVRARLSNLGYDCGDDDPNQLRIALLRFQRRFGLQATGQADDATRDKLSSLHDSVCAFPAAGAASS